MRLEHHLVGGYVRYISPHIIIIIKLNGFCYLLYNSCFCAKVLSTHVQYSTESYSFASHLCTVDMLRNIWLYGMFT